MDGFFQHKKIYKYTWHQPTRNLSSNINYTILRKYSAITVNDVRAMRDPECGTDHYMVRGLATFKAFQITKGKPTHPGKPNQLKRVILVEKENNKYESFKRCIHQAASEALGGKVEIITNTKK